VGSLSNDDYHSVKIGFCINRLAAAKIRGTFGTKTENTLWLANAYYCFGSLREWSHPGEINQTNKQTNKTSNSLKLSVQKIPFSSMFQIKMSYRV
jgi:hypothetical protein